MNSRRFSQQKIQLVLAGMLVAGMIGSSCERRVVLENNAYVSDKGYFHSESGGYYPYPYNYYVAGMGYYGGPRGWSPTPFVLTRVRAVPSFHYTHVSVSPGVPIPAPRPSQVINNYRYNLPKPTVKAPVSAPSVSKPAPMPSRSPSSGTRVGGFGSSGSKVIS